MSDVLLIYSLFVVFIWVFEICVRDAYHPLGVLTSYLHRATYFFCVVKITYCLNGYVVYLACLWVLPKFIFNGIATVNPLKAF